MRTFYSFLCISLALLLCGSALAQRTGPQGYLELRKLIDDTNNNALDSLLNKVVILTVPTADADKGKLVVTPESVFRTEKVDEPERGRYRVTIFNPKGLIPENSKPGEVVYKAAIGYHYEIRDDNPFGVRLEGVSECLYNVRFRQRGGGDLLLPVLKEQFDTSWQLVPDRDAKAVESGPGLTVTRSAGSSEPLSVRLVLKDKKDGKNVATVDVPIATCQTARASLPPVAQTLPALPNPQNCFEILPVNPGYCDECGFVVAGVTLRIENSCRESARVTCDVRTRFDFGDGTQVTSKTTRQTLDAGARRSVNMEVELNRRRGKVSTHTSWFNCAHE